MERMSRFDELVQQYRDAWRKADDERKATSKISRKTSKLLARIADELNKEEKR